MYHHTDLSFSFVAGSPKLLRVALKCLLPSVSPVVRTTGLYHQSAACVVSIWGHKDSKSGVCTRQASIRVPPVALSGSLYVSGDGGEKDISSQGQGQPQMKARDIVSLVALQ